MIPVLGATDALGATAVQTTNPSKLTAAGPVNSVHGFPAWYQDSANRRLEPCLDQDNPMCGILAGEVPAPGPIVFPSNFPGEFFYQRIDSDVALPGGGSAVLTLGLEGAFANEDPIPGDQLVFARTRIVVKGGPANSTLTFTHPFGTATVDTDATGAGRLVQDISPAAGNFATPLKGNFGPFLTWDTGTVKDSTGEYVGDPAVEHKVTGSPFNTNVFSVSGAGVTASNDLFTITGKVSTNTGVKAEAAVLSADGKWVDVFATSTGEQLQVSFPGLTTPAPMVHDAASDRFYSRIALTGAAPAEVTVTNIGDKPASTSTVAAKKPSGITITKADFDGAKLTVAATAADGGALKVTGFGDLVGGTATFNTFSPPPNVEVTGAGGAATAPVVITAGTETKGQPAVTPAPDPGPVTDTGTGTGTGTGTAVAAPTGLTATAGTNSIALSWTAVTDATRYQVQVYDAAGVLLPAASQPVVVTAPATTQNIVGLTTGTGYQFTVKATTAAGTSAESAPRVSAATAAETAAITSARYRAGKEFRVGGTSTATRGTVSVYAVDPRTAGAAPIAGMADAQLTAAAPPATGTTFDVRPRTGLPPNPGRVWIKTSGGAIAGPFTVTN